MSLLLLFVSFFFALYGAWVFFSGYAAAANPNEELIAAMVGLAFTLIPYIVAKSLSEMVAIRQRHLQLEQTSQFHYMVAEQMEIARRMAQEQAKSEPQLAKTAPKTQEPAE